jgi:hypothetical protein
LPASRDFSKISLKTHRNSHCQEKQDHFPKGKRQLRRSPEGIRSLQELARQKSPEAIITLANIMNDEKAPPAARVAAANALLDRGYGKPIQPISQTLAKIDPSSISDEELAAIAINGAFVNAQAR